MHNKQLLLAVICIAITVFVGFLRYFDEDKPIKKNSYVPQEEPFNFDNTSTGTGAKIKENIPKDLYNVGVNSPVPLSYKTKEEIYNIRRSYVEKSIFASSDYEPSDEVFGQIVDNKPWYSTDFCRDYKTNLPKINGDSEESRFINNPTMLVAIEYPFLWKDTTDYVFCNSPTNHLLPTNISYSKSKNEIIVTYSELPFGAPKPFFYDFNGLNAVDLGYRYAYVDLSKSTYKPNFSEPSNISTDVQRFQNFIHVGFSCEHEGGCNNGSPRQQNLEFNLEDNENSEGEIYIKLWHSRPSSKDQKPDIVERIIIES